MRPIQFRAWQLDPITNKWCMIDDLKSWQVYELNSPTPKEEIVMQFTGLLDKNGTKIFEGDIVRCETGDDGDEKIRLFVCRYQIPRMQFTLIDIRDINVPKNGLIRICGLEGFEEYINSTGQYPWAEVIGNIYESPELLK